MPTGRRERRHYSNSTLLHAAGCRCGFAWYITVCLDFIVCLNSWRACSYDFIVWHVVWVLHVKPFKRLLKAKCIQKYTSAYLMLSPALKPLRLAQFYRHTTAGNSHNALTVMQCAVTMCLCLFCVRPLMSNIIFALFPSCRLLENSAILDQYERASMKYENMERKFAPAWFWWWWWRDTGEKDIANELKRKDVWRELDEKPGVVFEGKDLKL